MSVHLNRESPLKRMRLILVAFATFAVPVTGPALIDPRIAEMKEFEGSD